MTAEARLWLSLGSNIRPHENLRATLDMLAQADTLEARSALYRTPPRGDPDQADFLNMALRMRSGRTPTAFQHETIRAIERALGRQRDPRNPNAARTIDIDITLWNDEVLTFGEKPWHVPDPDLLRFAHVALPLAELDPDLCHPLGGETLADIAARLDARGIVRLPSGI